MLILILIIVAFFLIVLSQQLFKISFGNLKLTKYMPHTHLFLWQFTTLTLIGSNLMVLGVKSTTISNFVGNSNSYIYSLISVYYVMIMVPLSVVFFNRIFRFDINKKINKYLSEGFRYKYNDRDNIVRMFFLLFSLVSMAVVIYLSVHNAPLYLFLTGRAGRVSLSRVNYDRFFSGSLLIKNVVGESLIPLASYITFSYYRFTKERSWKYIHLIIMLCAIFVSGANMSKSGVAWYFLPYIFIITISDGKIPYRKLLKFGIGILLIVLSLYSAHYVSNDFGLRDILADFYSGPIGRILIGQIQSLPAYFEIFPEMYGFLHGKSIGILNYLHLPFVDAARVAAIYLEPSGVQGGWVNVANTLFVGDAYANFGFFGVIISPIWVGFVYAFIYWKMLTAGKNPIAVGLYVFILDNLTSSITGGFFSAFIFNTRIIAAGLFYFSILFFAHTFKRRKSTLRVDDEIKGENW